MKMLLFKVLIAFNMECYVSPANLSCDNNSFQVYLLLLQAANDGAAREAFLIEDVAMDISLVTARGCGQRSHVLPGEEPLELVAALDVLGD